MNWRGFFAYDFFNIYNAYKAVNSMFQAQVGNLPYLFGYAHCTPFLLFDGNCAAVMTFYQRCLGGELTLTKLGDTPMKDQFPVEKHSRIINAQLKSGAIDISATDWMASPSIEPQSGNMVSLFIVGQAYAELKAVFDQLAQGADPDPQTFIALHQVPFGSYGQLTDKYGVGWIFKGDKPN